MKTFFIPKKIDQNTLALLKQIFYGVLAISVAVGVITLIWYGTRLSAVTITEVQVEGGQTINHEAVSQLAAGQLEGEYVGLVPKRFAWMYPKQEIAAALTGIERIEDIEVSRINGNTVLVSFDEFLPDSLWCPTVESNECVFIDEFGYAYAKSPMLDGGSFLRFVHNSVTPEVGKSLVTAEDYALLKQLADSLFAQGWFISHIEVDAARDAFLRVVGGGEFKVTLTQEPEQTVNNLMVVLTSDEFSDVKPGGFQYIDLRFGNKVFVNEEKPSAEVDAESEVLPEETEVITDELEEIESEPEPEVELEAETAASDDAAGE